MVAQVKLQPKQQDEIDLEREAKAIRGLVKQFNRNVIEIGRHLTIARDHIRANRHGDWGPWLEREFEWTDRTALNFIHAYQLSLKCEKFSDLKIEVSAVYLIARPSTSEEVRNEMLARAENGEKITHKSVVESIKRSRPKVPYLVSDRGTNGRMERLAEDVTVYLGDCRDILPTLKNIDAVVSDPPYGIGFNYGPHYRDDGGDAYIELISALKPWPRCLLQYPEEAMRYYAPTFGPPENHCQARTVARGKRFRVLSSVIRE
jgi:Protein of unknown function (DUF3102)